MYKLTIGAAYAVAFAILSMSASAIPIPVYGGSDLLSADDAGLLAQWRHAGSMTLTNIFDKEPGDTATDWHAAVDDRGATFTIIEVTGNVHGTFDEAIIIGGYNPVSWGGAGYTTNEYGSRDAFVFNLTTQTVGYQHQTGWAGQFQTYNRYNYGPAFGGGHDIYINNYLNYGYANGFSYGGSSNGTGWQHSILGAYGNHLSIGRLEVFAIDTTPVSEPGTIGLLGLGMAGLFFARKRKLS